MNKILVRTDLLLSIYWAPIHRPATLIKHLYYVLALIEYQLYILKHY